MNPRERGNAARLQAVLADAAETLEDEQFADAFKGVFVQKEMPTNTIDQVRTLLKERSLHWTKSSISSAQRGYSDCSLCPVMRISASPSGRLGASNQSDDPFVICRLAEVDADHAVMFRGCARRWALGRVAEERVGIRGHLVGDDNRCVVEVGESHQVVEILVTLLLAFWTGGDPARMERLFDRSGLVREKWRSRADYRERTIRTAIRSCHEFSDAG